MPADLIATHGHLAAAMVALDAGDYGSARAALALAMADLTTVLGVSSPSQPVDRDNSRLVDSGSIEALAAAQPTVEEMGARPVGPQHLGTLRETLIQHYVTAIDCDHEAKTDTVRCSCSVWTGTPKPNVGAAVAEWADHVLARMTHPAPPARARGSR